MANGAEFKSNDQKEEEDEASNQFKIKAMFFIQKGKKYELEYEFKTGSDSF